MSDSNRRWLFSDEQARRLTLGYLHSHGAASTEDIHAFLNACVKAATIGQSVVMAADGTLLIDWDKETGVFSFGLSASGLAEAKEKFGQREGSG